MRPSATLTKTLNIGAFDISAIIVIGVLVAVCQYLPTVARMIESLCVAVLAGNAWLNPVDRADRMQTCRAVAAAAIDGGIEPATLVAVAYVESGMKRNAVSKAGAVGPLQVLPKYFCPKRGACDHIAAGVRAFKAWRSRSKTLSETLCKYNAGFKCGRAGRRYARRVLRVRRSIVAASSQTQNNSSK